MSTAHTCLASAELIYPHSSGEVTVVVAVSLVRGEDGALPEPEYWITCHPPHSSVVEGLDAIGALLAPSVVGWGVEDEDEDEDGGEDDDEDNEGDSWGASSRFTRLTGGDDLWRLFCDSDLELRSIEVDSDLVGRPVGYHDADIEPVEASNAWIHAVHLSGLTREFIPLRLAKAAHRAMDARSIGRPVARDDAWALDVITA